MSSNHNFEINALDFFAAGLPAGSLFKMSFDDMEELVENSNDLKGVGLNPVAEVCLIGLVSHFEAFCKNQFASIINISPFLLNYFIEKRKETSIPLKDLLEFNIITHNKLGFLLSENYDFGSAKKINSLYFDLLSITPFSQDQISKYDQLLNDRNLLVHHAGIYTLKYQRNRLVRKSIKERVYFDSLIIRKRNYRAWAKFIDTMVLKIIENTYNKMIEVIKRKKIKLSKESKKALEYLKWYEIDKKQISIIKKYGDSDTKK
jgi:hypothetical protein